MSRKIEIMTTKVYVVVDNETGREVVRTLDSAEAERVAFGEESDA